MVQNLAAADGAPQAASRRSLPPPARPGGIPARVRENESGVRGFWSQTRSLLSGWEPVVVKLRVTAKPRRRPWPIRVRNRGRRGRKPVTLDRGADPGTRGGTRGVEQVRVRARGNLRTAAPAGAAPPCASGSSSFASAARGREPDRSGRNRCFDERCGWAPERARRRPGVEPL